MIRAASNESDEVAIAPIDLVGHPVGGIVDPSVGLSLLDVTVDARAAPDGIIASIRSALGGPTAYEVTVSVRNRSTETLSDIELTGSAGRSADDEVVTLELPLLGSIEPGQTWERVVDVVPAPALGRYVWQVTASGAGPATHAERAVSLVPGGLLLSAVIFASAVIAMVWRFVARRRGRHAERPSDGGTGTPAAVVPGVPRGVSAVGSPPSRVVAEAFLIAGVE